MQYTELLVLTSMSDDYYILFRNLVKNSDSSDLYLLEVSYWNAVWLVWIHIDKAVLCQVYSLRMRFVMIYMEKTRNDMIALRSK